MSGEPGLWSASQRVSRHRPSASRGPADPSIGKPIGLWGLAWRRFRRHRMALVGMVILLILASVSILATWISPYSPIKTSLVEMLDRPSTAHPMGTDELGRDLFTRILHGGRVSLAVGFLAVALAVSIGSTVGAVAGFYGGWVDNVLMRLVDFMIALPSIFVLILLATIYGTNPVTLVLVIGGLRWMGTARQVRGAFLSLREREFVEAARCLGASPSRIILRHLLPNAIGPIIVASTLGISGAILTESSLSYLGLGIQPPMASWGNMLRNAQDQMVRAPWTAVFPGLMIFLTVIAVNSIGDGLRDALDPRKVEER
ncbi:MAG: ABC transporter permease [Chloroflexi bacterium]|nr:ABC transporter permease [Chloroflexota bacterium]